jgi:hypothetical protein
VAISRDPPSEESYFDVKPMYPLMRELCKQAMVTCRQSMVVKCCLHGCHNYEEGFAKMLLIPHSQIVRTPHCQIVNPTLQAFCQNATNPPLSNSQLHIKSILPKCS